MTNPYYNGGSFPSTGSAATSASMRAELALITSGFDKLPILSGNGGKFILVNAGGTALEAVSTLTSLSITDSGFSILDNVDATKVIKFEASAITTGTTRTYTLPDANVVLVGDTNAQTLTNKTLTSPRVGTSLLDTNGNELFLLTATASAVNELTYANAATGNAPTFTASGNDANISINLVPKGTGTVQANGATVLSVGATTIYVPAIAMVSRITNGATLANVETTTNKVMIKTFDFDPATNEFVQFAVRMPKSWNEGTVTAFFLWSNASGTGNVVWAIQGLARSDDDVLDTAFGTAVTVTDGVTAAGDLMQSAQTGAITIGGTPAENDLVIFQAYRNAADGADTLATDARLHGVVIVYTTNATNDA